LARVLIHIPERKTPGPFLRCLRQPDSYHLPGGEHRPGRGGR
jgi:hypothetical protein